MTLVFPICCLPVVAAWGLAGPKPVSAEKNAPDILFDKKTYDFGVAGQHESIIHEFGFTNVGEEVLVIEAVKTTCGCIATVASAKEILPGERGVIKADFRTSKRKGKQRKTIHVHSNDPDEPQIELEITGVIKTEVALEPEFLYFGKVDKGETVTKTLKVIQVGDRELSLNRVETAEEYFTTRISGLETGRNTGHQIDVILRADAPVGRFSDVITLHTNLRKRPRIDVPLYGAVLGRIRVKPQMLSFGTLRKGGIVANRLEIVSADHNGFDVVRVVPSPPFISAEVTRADGGKLYEITLKVDENAPVGRVAGEIHIFTDDPDESLIKVPVYGRIAG